MVVRGGGGMERAGGIGLVSASSAARPIRVQLHVREEKLRRKETRVKDQKDKRKWKVQLSMPCNRGSHNAFDDI